MKKCSSCEVTTGQNKQHYWNNITITKTEYFEINDNFTCAAENAYGKANDTYRIPCFKGKVNFGDF
jgi:hypothetical protein